MNIKFINICVKLIKLKNKTYYYIEFRYKSHFKYRHIYRHIVNNQH